MVPLTKMANISIPGWMVIMKAWGPGIIILARERIIRLLLMGKGPGDIRHHSDRSMCSNTVPEKCWQVVGGGEHHGMVAAVKREIHFEILQRNLLSIINKKHPPNKKGGGSALQYELQNVRQGMTTNT